MPIKYRIISCDGGLRGIVTLTLLHRLQEQVPDLITTTNMFAGTSTGGIIALALANVKPPAEFCDFYVQNGHKIFDRSWQRDLMDIGGVSGAEYDNGMLKSCLIDKFGMLKLGDLQHDVFIPSFELDNHDTARRSWNPRFFHNLKGVDSDRDELVVDVAMRTSAAPTYFPSYGSFVDGGMCANNPSMAALAQTQDLRCEIEPRPSIDQIAILSLGTGVVLNYIAGENLDWGLAHWAKPLVNLLMDATAGIADYQCKQLLRDNYFRLAPMFPPGVNIKLDEWQRAADLVAFANQVDLTDTVAWLKAVGW